MENEEQKEQQPLQQSKEENIDITIYINKIEESIKNIENSYSIPFSIIRELLKFQKESETEQNELFSMNLTGEAKLKSEIYSSDTFLKQITTPITDYIEKKEHNDKKLEQILKNINDFLFRIDFQFDRYLQKKDEKILFNNDKQNKKDTENKENIKEIKYDSIQHSNVIFSFSSFRIMIKDMYSDMTLLSLLFQIQKMNTKLENKINNHNKKIQKHEKEAKEQEKNMMTTMGIFISIFSLIQVNLTFFSKFESLHWLSWVILILVINITLAQTIKVIFNLIHQKNNNQEDIISLINKKLYDKFSSWINKKENETKIKKENTKNINQNTSQNNNLNTEQDKDTNNTNQ